MDTIPRGGLEIPPHARLYQRQPAYFPFNAQSLCMWEEKKSPNTAIIQHETNIFAAAFTTTQI
jgi:hypothetical protein